MGKEMGVAISKLSVLSEIQKDLKENAKEALKQGGTPSETPEVFKGVRRACTIAFAGFKNCCTHRKGWGISVGLSKCKAEEIDLAERRENGLCHEIGGTYCAERVLKECIRKKRGFCCFPSRLARILHEAAREQLGISWGSAEHPNCRGLTADEIARINFDKLDLRELIVDIKVTLPDPQKIQERLKARLKLMETEATAEGAQ
jgi:conjugal transfer mating pair stabilization protein TraN